jgi:outer membrane protein assembly factor BamB
LALSGCWLQTASGPTRNAYNDLETTVTAANVNGLTVRWTGALGGKSGSEALVDRGSAYVRSDGRLTAFNLANGATRWSVPVGGSNNLPGGSASVPAIVDDALWVPTTGPTCRLVEVDPATGATLGETIYDGTVPGPNVSFASCQTGNALAVGTKIVVPSKSATLITGAFQCPAGQGLYLVTSYINVIDVGSGRSWDLGQSTSNCGSPNPDVPAYQPVSVTGDLLLVPSGQTVTAYPLAGCALSQPCPPTWSVDAGAAITSAPVVLPNGDIALSLDDGRVVVVDGSTHTVAWTATLNGSVFGRLAASGTAIYAVTTNATATSTALTALPLDGCGAPTCSPLWDTTFPSAFATRPSVGGNVVYVAYGRTIAALPATGCGSAHCVPLWTGPATGLGNASIPVISDGVVLASTSDGTATAFAIPH